MPFDAADLCALIIAHLDGIQTSESNGTLYTYGARPGDICLLPPPTRTTVVVATGQVARWFEVAVREVQSADGDLWELSFDPEIVAELSQRANVPLPMRPFG